MASFRAVIMGESAGLLDYWKTSKRDLPQVRNANWLNDPRTVRRPHGTCTFEAIDGDGSMLKADLALLCLASCATFQLANMGNSAINMETIAAVSAWPWKANVRIPDMNARDSRLRSLHAHAPFFDSRSCTTRYKTETKCLAGDRTRPPACPLESSGDG